MASRWLWSCRRLVCLAAVLAAGCYTGPINMRPTVEIKRPTSRIFRGQMANYTALTYDPDDDGVTLQWTTTPGSCPDNFKSPDAWPRQGWMTENVAVVASSTTRAMFCVWVKATDTNGAEAVDAYTEIPLNHLPEPRIQIVLPEPQDLAPAQRETFPLHTMFKFSGAGSTDDDQGDRQNFTFEWRLKDSPSEAGVLIDCPHETIPENTCLIADVAGSYVLELRVSDNSAASVGDGSDTAVVEKRVEVDPGHAPVARVKVLRPLGGGPYPLGTRFKVTAVDSFDVDPGDDARLIYVWTPDYSRAPASSENFGPCVDEEPTPLVRCFTADGEGEYGVSLQVIDPSGSKSAPETLELPVDGDQMPCIGATEPDFATTALQETLHEKAGTPKKFNVQIVLDDLDPYPNPAAMNDTTKFDWFLSVNGGDFELAIGDSRFPTFTTPSKAAVLGNEVRVRVQIRDRDASRSRLEFSRCGDEDRCAAPANPTCFQRLTWKVRYDL